MTTKWACWAFFVAIVGFDVWQAAKKDGLTISEAFRKTTMNYPPILVLAWGVLTGHLFWYQGP